MKKNVGRLGILVLVCALTIAAGTAFATVLGSTHDFSWNGTSGFQSTQDQVCIFCHTPHNAIVTGPGITHGPIWNRDLNTNGSFTMYSSPTFQGGTTYINSKPTAYTLLCLSCHDGVTAISAIVNTYSSGNIIMQNGLNSLSSGNITYPPYLNPIIGTDLSNDHPVSFVYDDNLVSQDTADRGRLGLKAPNNIAPLKLYNTRLECSTCHDVHESGEPDKFPYLRMSNANSDMCLTCHIM